MLEVAGSGHIDGAGVFFLLLSIWLLARPSGRGRGAAAGSAFAASVLTKLFPLILLPVLFSVAGQRRRLAFLGAFAVTAFALTAAFLPAVGRSLGTLATYGRNWEFEGFAFRTLRRWTGSGDWSRILLAAGFLLAGAWLYRSLWHRERSVTAELRLPMRAGYGVALAYLLLTPTLHPWYALYLSALIPFVTGWAGLALSGAVFLGYRVLLRYALDGRWVESGAVSAAIFAAPVAAVLLRVLARRMLRAEKASADVSSRLP